MTDHDISTPVQEIAHQNKTRIRALGAGVAVVVVLMCAIVGSVVQRSIDSADAAHQLARAIAEQRYEECLAQNHRHDQSLGYILKLSRQQEAKATPAVRHQIEQQIGEYRILFQYLQPKQNCKQVKL